MVNFLRRRNPPKHPKYPYPSPRIPSDILHPPICTVRLAVYVPYCPLRDRLGDRINRFLEARYDDYTHPLRAWHGEYEQARRWLQWVDELERGDWPDDDDVEDEFYDEWQARADEYPSDWTVRRCVVFYFKNLFFVPQWWRCWGVKWAMVSRVWFKEDWLSSALYKRDDREYKAFEARSEGLWAALHYRRGRWYLTARGRAAHAVRRAKDADAQFKRERRALQRRLDEQRQNPGLVELAALRAARNAAQVRARAARDEARACDRSWGLWSVLLRDGRRARVFFKGLPRFVWLRTRWAWVVTRKGLRRASRRLGLLCRRLWDFGRPACKRLWDNLIVMPFRWLVVDPFLTLKEISDGIRAEQRKRRHESVRVEEVQVLATQAKERSANERRRSMKRLVHAGMSSTRDSDWKIGAWAAHRIARGRYTAALEAWREEVKAERQAAFQARLQAAQPRHGLELRRLDGAPCAPPVLEDLLARPFVPMTNPRPRYAFYYSQLWAQERPQLRRKWRQDKEIHAFRAPRVYAAIRRRLPWRYRLDLWKRRYVTPPVRGPFRWLFGFDFSWGGPLPFPRAVELWFRDRRTRTADFFWRWGVLVFPGLLKRVIGFFREGCRDVKLWFYGPDWVYAAPYSFPALVRLLINVYLVLYWVFWVLINGVLTIGFSLNLDWRWAWLGISDWADWFMFVLWFWIVCVYGTWLTWQFSSDGFDDLRQSYERWKDFLLNAEDEDAYGNIYQKMMEANERRAKDRAWNEKKARIREGLRVGYWRAIREFFVILFSRIIEAYYLSGEFWEAFWMDMRRNLRYLWKHRHDLAYGVWLAVRKPLRRWLVHPILYRWQDWRRRRQVRREKREQARQDQQKPRDPQGPATKPDKPDDSGSSADDKPNRG